MSQPINGYARTSYDGHTVNRRTKAILTVAADKLGYDDGLTVFQGSYNPGGVGASGGTHDGGGAADLSPFEWQRKVKALRDLGGAAWHRPAITGLWGEHVHVVFAGDREMSQAAKDQIADYKAGRNGLADNGPDNFDYHPTLVPFDYPAYVRARRRRRRGIAALTESIRELLARRRRLTRRITRKRNQREDLRGTH